MGSGRSVGQLLGRCERGRGGPLCRSIVRVVMETGRRGFERTSYVYRTLGQVVRSRVRRGVEGDLRTNCSRKCKVKVRSKVGSKVRRKVRRKRRDVGDLVLYLTRLKEASSVVESTSSPRCRGGLLGRFKLLPR